MIFLLLVLLAVGIVLTAIGVMHSDSTLLNLGLSWISGTIVGALCNFAISIYYRKRDKKITEHNHEISVKKEALVEQYNALQELLVAYMDRIGSLNAYFSCNENVQNGVAAQGYYELCKSSWNIPSAKENNLCTL